MQISEESLKYIAELFNGDIDGIFVYKSGPKIFKFFNKYFNYDDVYSFGKSYPSRWNITYNKLVEIWNKSLFDKFLTRILSISYLKTEYGEKSNDELENISNEAMKRINKVFENDGNRVVKFADRFQLILINDDEIFIGEGGYAYCYYVKSKQLVEKRLKEENYIDQSIVHRFKREFSMTKSLNDLYGIIKVFNFDEKRLAYTMERGECDLFSYIKKNELNDDLKKKIIYQIVYIMQSVHERDIIHRDLSPSNIFIIGGQLKIADFGLGKDLNAFYSHQTMRTNSVGQYYYCDPRQFMKLKDGDKLSDIYSIGKIINFIMTKSPNSVTHKYYSVVEKATCDEKFRYKSINDLFEGLRKIDSIVENKAFENEFLKKIQSKEELKENDISYICSFNDKKMYEMIKIVEFRISFVSAKERELLGENEFLDKLNLLKHYYENNRVTWNDYDDIGYFGITILLSKCSYISKEIAIDFINMPIKANRFKFIDMVKNQILGNIDPTLEEKIDINIK